MDNNVTPGPWDRPPAVETRPVIAAGCFILMVCAGAALVMAASAMLASAL